MHKTKKKMLTTALLLLLTTLLPTVAHAKERLLQVWQTDGQVVTISLNKEPVTTYENRNLIITTTNTTITYPLEQVSRFTYAVEEIVSEGDGVPDGIKNILSNDGETMTFKGLKSNTDIQIYSASGQLLRTVKPNGDKAAVSLSQLPTGVYLVKANGVIYKISKR